MKKFLSKKQRVAQAKQEFITVWKWMGCPAITVDGVTIPTLETHRYLEYLEALKGSKLSAREMNDYLYRPRKGLLYKMAKYHKGANFFSEDRDFLQALMDASNEVDEAA